MEDFEVSAVFSYGRKPTFVEGRDEVQVEGFFTSHEVKKAENRYVQTGQCEERFRYKSTVCIK